jgi:hypothetical protein
MIKMNRLVIIFGLLVLVIVFIMCVFFMKNEISSDSGSMDESNIEDVSGVQLDFEKKYLWNDIGIKPKRTIEGTNYIFTAFDFNENTEELIISGNYGVSKVLFIKDSLVEEMIVSDIPIDIFVHDENVYLLGFRKFIIIRNKEVIKEIDHNIRNVTTFDKLLFFEGKPTILMSDGSTYNYFNGRFLYSRSLLTQDSVEVWVQKTSSKSFEIRSNVDNSDINLKAMYLESIGSITFWGDNIHEFFVVVDVINGINPVSVTRVLKKSNDSFKETIFELPVRSFSYIKNDIKIHEKTLYVAIVNEQNLIIRKVSI